MKRKLFSVLAISFVNAFLWARLGFAQAQLTSPTTAEIFKQFSEQVVKIEVVESGSGAKASVGSGFFATERGQIVTNYHVVSKLIHSPDRYRIDIVAASGQMGQAAVLAFDVIYDLAVLRIDRSVKGFLRFETAPVAQGTRLYSLGHPQDLGLTIVEGTYNGLLQHSLYPKVHFTGSLNPGMSGGPAVTHAGKVVGINVATEGEQISFLVPAARAVSLLEKAANIEKPSTANFLAEVGRQIQANQARYLDGIFSNTTPSVTLGPYSLPTKPAEFFRCWADALRRKELPYVVISHDCSTDDYIFVSSEQSSGIVRFYHQLLSTEELNPARFFTLYSSQVQAGNVALFGNEEEVTPFRCLTRNLQTQGGKLKGVLCARQYVKLPGLYDAVFRGATLGARNVGLVTTLSLSGVSFENVQTLTRRYGEAIRWRR
ncbi:MAG TPA: serine protease [Candidatus Binatia bacterium]